MESPLRFCEHSPPEERGDHADLANRILTVDVEAPSPYDTMVPCIALLEALVAGVGDRLGDAPCGRISAPECLREGYTWDDQELPRDSGE